MATSKVSSEERLLRKRQAARVRQQRCRARKRQALLERQTKDKSENVTQPGNVALTPSENHHPNMSPSHRSPPLTYVRAESPRSVFWKEATGWAHVDASHGYERRQPWLSPRLETRFDYSTAEGHPIYPRRYMQNPSLVASRSVPRLVPTIRHPHPRFYIERRPQFVLEQDQPEIYRRVEINYHQAARSWPPTLKATPHKIRPRLLPGVLPKVLQPPERSGPVKSAEEAAIDAILSLKAEVVAPPTAPLV